MADLHGKTSSHHHGHVGGHHGSSHSHHNNTGRKFGSAPSILSIHSDTKVPDKAGQEVTYLKKTFGPVLVAALNEICIRRPTDPVDYLGHWLLRYRFNQESKRRDVDNALDIVRQKEWAQSQDRARQSSSEMGPESRGSRLSMGEGGFSGEGDSLGRLKIHEHLLGAEDDENNIDKLFRRVHALSTFGQDEFLGEESEDEKKAEKIEENHEGEETEELEQSSDTAAEV